MYFNNVQNTIRDFQSRRAALDADRELSDYGRQLRQARLQNEISAYRSDALIFLRADYQALKKSFDDWQVQTREAQERSSAAWDYQRLAYGAESLRAQLAQAFASENIAAGTGSALANIAKQFERVSDLGDKHTQRTWAEIAPAVIRAHAKGIEAESLADRMAQTLPGLLESDEQRKLKSTGEAIGAQVLTWAEAAREASSYYNDIEFSRLLSGISVKTVAFNPDDTERFITQEISFV